MSRSGYDDYEYDVQGNALAMWREQVASAIRGRRGQAFLREMRDVLDAMPRKRLIKNELEIDGEVCAIGAVGACRGVNMFQLDPEDYDSIAGTFDIAHQLVREIECVNDEEGRYDESPEDRWRRVRAWVESQIKE